MFTSLYPDSNRKQSVTCLATLCAQFAVLVILVALSFSSGSGPHIRRGTPHSAAVTPLYFHPDAVAAPAVDDPVLAELPVKPQTPSPETPSELKQPSEQEAITQADATDDGSANGDGEGSSWQMDSVPSGFEMNHFGTHHYVSTAQPVLTPEPPILHSETPELARGKDVIFEIVIDNRGLITEAVLLQGIGDGNGVEQSIFQTLRQWTFVPAKFDGVGVPSRRQLRFHFPG
jgi:hypothetical protein